MSTSEHDHSSIQEAWSEWTKLGKQNVQSAIPQDSTYASTSDDDNMTNAGAMSWDCSRVQIVKLLRATLSDIQDYVDPTELVPQSAGNVSASSASSHLRTTPPAVFASMKEIALHHNLNQKQYYAFLLLGAVLLHFLLIMMYGQEVVDAACEPPDGQTDANSEDPLGDLRSIMVIIKHLLGTEPNSNKVSQLVMFFGGEAGSGKTEVTKAVTTLAKLWRVTHVLRKAATTGAAASLIGGSTIHSLTSIMQRLENVKFVLDLSIALLLIDEVSMFDLKLNGYMTQTLQKLLNVPLRILGGVNVGYLGDLFQLPPVDGQPVYQRNIAQQGVHVSTRASNGEAIWHDALHSVILLDKNFRQDDLQFLQICRAVRWGKVTPKELDALNTRVITDENMPPTDALIIFPENKQVLGVNTIMVHRHAQANQLPVIRLLAHVYKNTRDASRGLITDDSHPVFSGYLVKMPGRDGWRSGLLSILDLHYGAPVILCDIGNDLQMKYNIGNNTHGTFVGLWPPSSNDNLTGRKSVTLVGDDTSGTVYYPAAGHEVTHLLIEIKCHSGKEFKMEGLPPNVYAIPRKQSARASLCQDGSKHIVGQFPVRALYASTADKVQGLSLDRAIVLGANNNARQNYLYVVLTRVHRLTQIYLARALTMRDMSFCGPKAMLRDEMARLTLIETATIQRIESCPRI